MAINIEWQSLPTQNENDDIQPQLYPRMTHNEVADFQVLCEKIAKYGSHTKGTVISVLTDMADIMAELLREGKTVDIDTLGTFKLSIGTDAAITPEMPYQKRKVTVRSVNFQPRKELMEAIGTPEFHTVPRNASPVIMTMEQLRHTLQEYFKTHDSITRSQFEELCKLKQTTAYVRLNELVESGFLRKVGYNKDTKYEIVHR